MDKKIYRWYTIAHRTDQELPDWNELVMFSQTEGEFGPISLEISAQLDSQQPNLSLTFHQTSAAAPEVISFFRLSELYHFLKILPLFNPLNFLNDEVPFPPASEQKNP